jgi:hypothetical protein
MNSPVLRTLFAKPQVPCRYHVDTPLRAGAEKHPEVACRVDRVIDTVEVEVDDKEGAAIWGCTG